MKDKEILIGTSGYTFDDWKGAFYPENVARKHWLPYYAQFFDVAEINTTYYAIPRPGTLGRMAEITPEGFQFIVKLPGEITHKRDGDLGIFDAFNSRIEELTDAGKLSGLLAQFPFSFKRNDRNEAYLPFMRENLPGDIPLFVEFRHKGWDDGSAIDLVERERLLWVSPDEPDIPQLMSRRVLATGDTAYVRLHSRDADKWWSEGGQLRYDYYYNDTEIGEVISRIDALPSSATKVFVFFNNCHGSNAVRNALMMKGRLGQSIEPRGGQIGLL